MSIVYINIFFNSNKKKNIYIIRKILMLSFPILLGYIPLGMTFGILANKIQQYTKRIIHHCQVDLCYECKDGSIVNQSV